MEDRIKGWTGKRLLIDLGIQRAWTEEIPIEELQLGIGGRGLNGRFFLDRVPSLAVFSDPENPIAFSVGPLAGTYAPCAGWTSISTLSPLSYPSAYAHGNLPGHWGPQLKFAGFDQLIITGKAENPVCLTIEGERVSFENGKGLWGKDTVETTVAIEEEKRDRNIEVLCIGPAGENLVFFANVTNRFSWTADHIGLGYLFGSKNLKAIAVRGDRPVSLHDPDRFLQICIALRQRMQRDPHGIRLKEEGSFLLLKQNGEGFGIRNYNESSSPDVQARWASTYFTDYFYGKEACFSCPIHCGRVTDVNGNYFGGVHVESAWSLGPRMGIDDWGKTLLLHRICQLLGLDPSSTGSLLSWIMDCYEKGILSSQELGPIPCRWGDEKAAIQLIESIVEQKGVGEAFCQGSFLTAQSLGKGLEEVPHFRGADFPVRDPRSSMKYALNRALFPMEWDYLQSLTDLGPPFSSGAPSQGNEENEMLAGVWASERQKILADMNSLCPLVLARLPLLAASDVEELLSTATGRNMDGQTLMAAVQRTIETEKALCQRFKSGDLGQASLPLRFFKDPMEKSLLERELASYAVPKESGSL
jgi:aldehyde:ferredoxin oxidoreductase